MTTKNPEPMGIDISRKLTPDTVMAGTLKDKVPTDREWLYRIAGVASSFRKGTGTYGDWVMLTGEFQSVRLDTGEVSIATECAIPAGISEMLANRIESGEASVAFMYDVGWEPSRKEPTKKYQYVVRAPDIDPRESTLAKRLASVPMPVRKSLPPGTT